MVIFYLTLPFFLTCISLLFKRKYIPEITNQMDIACIITAYKQIKITKPLLQSLLNQNYKNFFVYLVADNPEDFDLALNSPQLAILNPTTILGSKVKSLKFAFDNFVRNHEAVMVLDPDNLIHPEALVITNNYLQYGYKAVQAKRCAKNTDSKFAKMDAMGELYYNYQERYVPFKLGSSASISGSGMTIETSVFRKMLFSEEMNTMLNGVILGEDKFFQNKIVDSNYIIAYAEDALVYDEKIANAEQVTRQRTRWIKAYFESFGNLLNILFKGFYQFNWNKFLFALQLIKPPLFLFLSFSLVMAAIMMFVSKAFSIALLVAIIIFSLNFLFVLRLANAPSAIWKTLINLPLFILAQFKSMAGFKKTKNDFLITEKVNSTTIEEILNANNVNDN